MKENPFWWEGTIRQRFQKFDPKKLGYADVVIIGGGLSGLSAAYHLKQSEEFRDKTIVVLEAELIGSGATGKSGGFLAPSVEADVIDVIHEFGKRGGEIFWNLKTDLAKKLVELIKRHGIKCDLKNVGSIYLQTDDSEEWRRYFRKEAALRKSFGYETELLTRDQLHRFLGPVDSFYGGIYNPNEYCINPMLFLIGFAAVCNNLGVSIFEKNKVLGVKNENGKNIVRTEHGDITANRVIYACWTDILKFVKLKEAEKSYTFLLATPELSNQILEEIGVREGLMLWDAVPPPQFTYFRILRKRLLFGGFTTFKEEKMEKVYSDLKERMLSYFPPLKKLKNPVEYFWHGDFLTMGFDERPGIGYIENTDEKQIFIFGPGLLFAFLCGIMARDWLVRKLSRETEMLNSIDKRYFSKRSIASKFPRLTKALIDWTIFR